MSARLVKTATVAQLRQTLISIEPRLANKLLRFIVRGRVLSDNATLASVGLEDGDVVHCAVADLQLPPPSVHDQAQEDRRDTLAPNIIPNVGFDRLREAGFSEEDIVNFRQQFHNRLGAFADEETLRRREEDWMAVAAQQGQFSGDRSYLELVGGLLLGFLAGFVVVFFLREHQFTQSQFVGIIAGVLINLAFGMLRSQY